MTPMNPCPSATLVEQFLAEALSPCDTERIAAHVESCAACQRTIEQMLDTASPAAVHVYAQRQGMSRERPPSRWLHAAIQTPANATASLATAPAHEGCRTAMPSVPGYELLEEIGRGGMGVVYKARHQSLDRLVAIKMLAQSRGSAADHQRMLTEAQAAARMHHPHIVQIFEIGALNGEPYLVLEYMARGSLAAQLAGQPQPLRAAAQLAALLARAVHCANQQGILHRDLKPANVLLRDADAAPAGGHWLDGFVAKIADFGLAKRLDHATGQTASDTIVGTPSYMAPEQAQRSHAALGPAVDVYGLGAILYELLTGRPPFRAETAMDTLVQVIHTDPVAPSRLRPGLPRDLETICLKCLHKEPARRYAGADALADDLQRYCAGQPILARPPSWIERSWRWCWRNPALAAMWTALLLVVVAAFGLVTWQWQEADWSFHRAEQETQDKETALGDKQLALADAEENFAKALEAVDKMLARVAGEQLEFAPRMDPVRLELAQEALAFYQWFLRKKPGDVRIRREVGLAHLRVAQLLRLMVRLADAERAFAQAVAAHESLVGDYPGAANHLRDLTRTVYDLGLLERQRGRAVEAEQQFARAVRLQSQVVALAADQHTDLSVLARCEEALALGHHDLDKLEAAEAAMRRSLDILDRLVRDHDRAQYRDQLARVCNNYSMVLRHAGTRSTERVKLLRKAIAAIGPAIEQFPNDGHFHAMRSVAYYNLVREVADRETRVTALSMVDAALAVHARLTAEYPDRPDIRYDQMRQYKMRAFFLRADNAAEAEAAFEHALKLGDKLFGEFPRREDIYIDLANIAEQYGDMLQLAGRLQEARRVLERALAHRGNDAAMPLNRMHRHQLYRIHALLADTLIRLKDHRAAVPITLEQPKFIPAEWRHDVIAAGYMVRCLGLVTADPELSDAERDRLEQQYAAHTADLLRQAVDHDWPMGLGNIQHPMYAPLLRRPDFPTIMTELRVRFAQRSVARQEQLIATQGGSVENRCELVRVLQQLALAEQPDRAAATFERAEAIARALVTDAAPAARGPHLLLYGQLLRAANRFTEAREVLTQGIQLQQSNAARVDPDASNLLHDLYWAFAEAAVQGQDHRAAAWAADGMAQTAPTVPAACARAARYFARCAEVAQQHAAPEERTTLLQYYGDRAMAYLHQEVDQQLADTASLHNPAHFAAIRSRADFQQLLATLAASKK
jgi:tetratricopeptide (TPR) repeat protein